MFRGFFDNIRYTVEDVVQDVKWRTDTVKNAVGELKDLTPTAILISLEEEEIKEILDEASKIINSAKRKYNRKEAEVNKIYQKVSKLLEDHYNFKLNILSELIAETQDLISEYKEIDWSRRVVNDMESLECNNHEKYSGMNLKSITRSVSFNRGVCDDSFLTLKNTRRMINTYKRKKEAVAYLDQAKVYKEEIELSVSRLKTLITSMKSLECMIEDEKILISSIIEKLNIVIPSFKNQLTKEKVTEEEMEEIEYFAELSDLLVQSLNMTCISDKGRVTQQYKKYLKNLQRIKEEIVEI